MQPIASWHGQPRRWPSHLVCKHWELIGESQAHLENPTPESWGEHQRNPHRLQPAPTESARLWRNYQAPTNYPRQQIHLLKQPKSQKNPTTHNPVRQTECMWPQWKRKIWKSHSPSQTPKDQKRPPTTSQDRSCTTYSITATETKPIWSQKRREGSPAMCEEAWTCPWRSGNGAGQITRRRNGAEENTAWEPARDEAKPKPEAEAWKEELNHWVGLVLTLG